MKQAGATKKGGKYRGFTLIELLLYIAILSVFVVTVGALYWMAIQSKVRTRNIANVDQQAEHIMSIITQEVRNSSAINAPAIGTSAGALTVDKGGTSMTFSTASGIVEVTEGSSPAIPLSSDWVAVSDLAFSNLSQVGTGETVRIVFTVTAGDYSKTYYGSATTRE